MNTLPIRELRGFPPRKPAYTQDRKHERRGSIPPETALVPTRSPGSDVREPGTSIAVSEAQNLGWNAAPASDRDAGLSLLKVACLYLARIQSYPAVPRNGSLG